MAEMKKESDSGQWKTAPDQDQHASNLSYFPSNLVSAKRKLPCFHE